MTLNFSKLKNFGISAWIDEYILIGIMIKKAIEEENTFRAGEAGEVKRAGGRGE
jgi:hypothetical protein